MYFLNSPLPVSSPSANRIMRSSEPRTRTLKKLSGSMTTLEATLFSASMTEMDSVLLTTHRPLTASMLNSTRADRSSSVSVSQ